MNTLEELSKKIHKKKNFTKQFAIEMSEEKRIAKEYVANILSEIFYESLIIDGKEDRKYESQKEAYEYYLTILDDIDLRESKNVLMRDIQRYSDETAKAVLEDYRENELINFENIDIIVDEYWNDLIENVRDMYEPLTSKIQENVRTAVLYEQVIGRSVKKLNEKINLQENMVDEDACKIQLKKLKKPTFLSTITEMTSQYYIDTTTENEIDMDYIFKESVSMYTLFEVLNTAGLIKLNSSSLKRGLEGIINQTVTS